MHKFNLTVALFNDAFAPVLQLALILRFNSFLLINNLLLALFQIQCLRSSQLLLLHEIMVVRSVLLGQAILSLRQRLDFLVQYILLHHNFFLLYLLFELIELPLVSLNLPILGKIYHVRLHGRFRWLMRAPILLKFVLFLLEHIESFDVKISESLLLQVYDV